MNAPAPATFRDTKRYRAFKVEYIGPTAHRPSRIKITDLYKLLTTTEHASVTFSYQSYDGNTIAQAFHYLTQIRNIPIEVYASAGDDIDLLLSSNFTTPLNQPK